MRRAKNAKFGIQFLFFAPFAVKFSESPSPYSSLLTLYCLARSA
jgi:hypothetical protein